MEQWPIKEKSNEQISSLIEILAVKEGMHPDDIDSDIITFAPVPGNEEFANPEYFEELAEMLGLSQKEMIRYAKNRWDEHYDSEA